MDRNAIYVTLRHSAKLFHSDSARGRNMSDDELRQVLADVINDLMPHAEHSA